MGVAVDESGEDEVAAGVDGLGGLVLRFDFGAWADGDDCVVLDRDASILVNRARGVHGYDDAAADDQVDFLLRLGGHRHR